MNSPIRLDVTNLALYLAAAPILAVGVGIAAYNAVMEGTHRGSKLIFTVLVHAHSPEAFEALREVRFRKLYSTDNVRKKYRGEFNTSYPAFHRYNDVAGYAELYWDGGTRILAQFYLRGDRRRKYGKHVTAGFRPKLASSNRFYPLYVLYVEAGGIPHPQRCSESVKRQAIVDGLEYVRKTAAELGCFVDLAHEHTLLEAIDMDRLFSK